MLQSWFWLALIASILWGLNYVANEYLLKYFNFLEIVFLESSITTIGTLIILLWQKNLSNFVKLTNFKVAVVTFLCGILYFVASILILKSINTGNASLAAVIEACYPIFTLIFAYLIFGVMQFSLLSLIGCILIISGIIVVKLG